MFLRFVYETKYDKGLSYGPFTGVGELLRGDKLESYEEALAETVFKWYDEFLPHPPWKRKNFHWSAVSWFKEKEAAIFIGKMWDLVSILKNHNIPVQLMRTTNPGLILYSDEFQVVAVAPKYSDNGFKKTRA